MNKHSTQSNKQTHSPYHKWAIAIFRPQLPAFSCYSDNITTLGHVLDGIILVCLLLIVLDTKPYFMALLRELISNSIFDGISLLYNYILFKTCLSFKRVL